MKSNTVFFIVFSLLFSQSVFSETLKGNYELKKSQVDYVVKYLIKKAKGSSTSSKGKGECAEKKCEFLVAAPVKSFDSRDSNRDFNMLKATKADKFPAVIARIKTSSELTPEFIADVEIEFAGEKHTYPAVAFKTSGNNKNFLVEGNVDVSLASHKIERPSLMGVHTEDIIPVSITADWEQK